MFCTKCGKMNEDGSAFCYACGNPLSAGPKQPASQVSQPIYPNQQPVYPQQPMAYPQQPMAYPQQPVVHPQQPVVYPQQPVVRPQQPGTSSWSKGRYGNKKIAEKKTVLEDELRRDWRNMVASPMMLIIAILYTFTLIINLVTIGDILDYASDLLYMVRNAGGLLFFGVLLGMSPSVLIVIGLWLTFVEGFKKNSPTVSTAGLSMIRVAHTITVIIIAVLMLLTFFTSCSAGAGMSFGVLLLFAGVIVYFAMNIKTVANSIDILDVCVPHTSGIIVLAVFRIIVLCGSVFALAFNFEFGFSALISLCSQVMVIVMLFIYRSRMENMEMKFDGMF